MRVGKYRWRLGLSEEIPVRVLVLEITKLRIRVGDVEVQHSGTEHHPAGTTSL